MSNSKAKNATTGAAPKPVTKVKAAAVDYCEAAHNGEDIFAYRGLSIYRKRADKKQAEVTVNLKGVTVYHDVRGSKAVSAAQTLISSMVTLKNERAKILNAKNSKSVSQLTIAELNERLANLDARARVALATAKFAGVDPTWLEVVTPANLKAS
jgi:CxxC motif-containing protein